MRSKAPLLLMEQIIMLLVFALAAALCLQAFVRSDSQSRQSQARDRAVTLCQSAAESVRGRKGDLEGALAEISGVTPLQRDGFGVFVNYNENWDALSYEADTRAAEGAAYTLCVKTVDSGAPELGKASVEAFAWGSGGMESLFAIEVAWQEVNGGG